MTQEEKRKQKYPDTEWFHYNNVNPKGKITTDCVYRAISNGMQIDYATVAREMTELQINTGWDTGEGRLISKYLESKGWIKHNQPRKHDNTKHTGKEFIDYVKKFLKADRVIMNIGSEHLTCMVNGKIEDIWNCTDNCVGVYWTK